MQFVTMQEMRSDSKELWVRLKNEGEVILTSDGKPVAVLAEVTEKNLEPMLKALRRARAAIAVEALQESALRTGTNKLSPREIEAEIKTARRATRK